MERYQQVEAMKPVHNSDTAVMAQCNLPSFVIIQNFEGVERLDKALYRGNRETDTSVIYAILAQGTSRSAEWAGSRSQRRC